MAIERVDPKLEIWKFTLPTGWGSFTLQIPGDPKFLDVKVQQGIPCLWAAVNPEDERQEYQFLMVATGAPVPRSAFGKGVYMGTFLLEIDRFVYHLFYVGVT